MDRYKHRREAGKILAKYLKNYNHQPNTLVLALPRGGVPVAYEIAAACSLPLDVFIVRKLGVPGHEELAFGALASHHTLIFNDQLLDQLNLEPSVIEAIIQAEQRELVRRESVYRKQQPFPELSGKTVILVDDGIATGATVQAAIKALKSQQPASIILAVPVAPYASCEKIKALVDKLICPLQPTHFNAVGSWYEDFSQTTDSEVLDLLEQRVAWLTR